MRITPNQFECLQGHELSGVTFVRDYLQLQFDPLPLLNVFTPISIISGNSIVRSGEEAFANAIVSQINKGVAQVILQEEDSLDLVFENTSIVSISIRPEDYVGPEAVNMYLPDQSIVVI